MMVQVPVAQVACFVMAQAQVASSAMIQDAFDYKMWGLHHMKSIIKQITMYKCCLYSWKICISGILH